MQNLENFPPVKWSLTHPRIAAWGVLSLGMITILVYEARDVGLQLGNWIALIVATILVAGACIWIVSWEDIDDDNPILTTTEITAITDTGETTTVSEDDTTTTA